MPGADQYLTIGLLIGGFAVLWYWRWRRGQSAASGAVACHAIAGRLTLPTLPAHGVRSETTDA